MAIRRYKRADAGRLLAYWCTIGAGIPYFFSVPEERWHLCLVQDEREGERVFKHIETYFVEEHDQILGLIQYGQPNLAWNTKGEKTHAPRIGVIRQLYFEGDRPDVGSALLEKAESLLQRFSRNYAFYHALGMSCTAYHGKLHCSQLHVERILWNQGFSVEHENVYYVLDLSDTKPADGKGLQLESAHNEEGETFELRLDGRPIGSAAVKHLDVLTDGYASDTVYLAWIGVDGQYRGLGFGSGFLGLLVERFRNQGYRYLHTDTAGDNLGAQRFYERQGFQRHGFTRSYVR